MDTSKIIKGAVSSGRYTVTAPIVKEDYGLYLQIEGVELPSTYEVDFSNSENSGTSVTMIGNADGVLIPSQFIKSGKDVFAFLYHVGSDFGRTVYKFRIPNKVRPDRTNEEPTPEEQSVIDQVIASLNDAVDRAEDAEQAIEDMSVSAQTLAEGSTATVTKTEQEGVVHLAFGIPKGATGAKGDKGDKGDTGATGKDGYSPTATVTKTGDTATITITDKNGTTTATVTDGADTQATWGTITGTLANQTDLQNALNNKADTSNLATVATTGSYDDLTNKLTAGTNITIDANNVISSTGGGGGGTGGHTILNENGSAMTARGKLQFMGATVTDDAVADKTVVSGLKGDTGEKGEKGDTGETGNGIASAVLNSNYTLTLNFTDSTSYTTPNPIRGEKGETGSQGPQGIQGEQGEQGERGLTGADGVSPTVTITPITGGHRITITDADGTETADVMDGHNGMVTVNVTGTTPTITAQADYRYVCGEVATLDFTPPSSGICDVVFTSGATATVLTVPSTIKWANGFDPTSLDANTTYEINIMDGLGVTASWT